uniref:Uncharacterized protein n=1 Tax=Pycnococcus provasolii TaxID=41880 RepID=A0A6U0B3W0_9CHLO|mmetsp:Transcript_1784/g.4020  ORF Transcript_1784/g.4020 Transcript_1784/m.4020 type:complete len:176 (+) Transcript_1784:163-690(+)
MEESRARGIFIIVVVMILLSVASIHKVEVTHAQGQTDGVGTLPGGGGGYLRGARRGGFVRAPQCFEVSGAQTASCESVQTSEGGYQQRLQQGAIGGGRVRRQYIDTSYIAPPSPGSVSATTNSGGTVDWSKLSPQQQMAALATVRSSAEQERLFILELEDYSPEQEEADGSYTGI